MNDLARAEEVARLHEVQVPAPAGHLARSAAAACPRNSPLQTGQPKIIYFEVRVIGIVPALLTGGRRGAAAAPAGAEAQPAVAAA